MNFQSLAQSFQHARKGVSALGEKRAKETSEIWCVFGMQDLYTCLAVEMIEIGVLTSQNIS